MERKKLIRPVTVLKVKKYMQAVSNKISKGENFSLDALAREHSISGSNGTALLRHEWITQGEVKGDFRFNEHPFTINDHNAKLLIEQVRLANTLHPPQTNANGAPPSSEEKDEQDVHLKPKSLKSTDITEILERVMGKKQPDLFDEQNSKQKLLLEVATQIASGVYGNLGINASQLSSLSKGVIEETNETILFVASNLINQSTEYKY